MFKYSKERFEEQFGKAIQVLEILETAGYDSYFVGGCVRDYILNDKFSDIDITTQATPDEIKKVFKRTIDTGIKHGTVTVLFNNESYEITTFRTEEDYENHRSPNKVEFVRSLEKDLERRDFTINAMALDSKAKLRDFHNGIDDLNNKIIKTVNEANERFFEDALRMLRAFRFSAKLQFDIEEKTYQAIKNNAHLIEFVSIERIVQEFRKLFSSSGNYNAMKLLLASSLNNYMPFFKKVKEITCLKSLTFEQAIYVLANMNNISIEEIRKLKLSNKEIAVIKNYKKIKEQFDSNVDLQKILYYNNIDDVIFVAQYFNLFDEKFLLDSYNNLNIYSVSDINITVPEIIELFNKKSGPWIKDVIKILEENILFDKLFNEKNKIVDFLQRIRDNINI